MIFEGLEVEKWWEKGNEGWVRVLEGQGLCQWTSHMKEMVGLDQRIKKQFCTKTYKLGLFGKVWRMSGENIERWTGASWVMKG